MKKTLCAILAVATMGMGLVACNKEAPEGLKTVESETCNITFNCPEAWEISHTDGMLSVYNPDDLSKANVTAFSFYHDLETDPEEITYWETYQKQLSDTFGEVALEKIEEEDFKSEKAAHAYYTVTIGEEKFDCETWMLIYGGQVYTLTLTQGAQTDPEQENYNDHSDEFAQIIKSINFN